MPVPGACRGQKGMSDALEPDLQIAVNCHMGAGNQTWTLCQNKSF